MFCVPALPQNRREPRPPLLPGSIPGSGIWEVSEIAAQRTFQLLPGELPVAWSTLTGTVQTALSCTFCTVAPGVPSERISTFAGRRGTSSESRGLYHGAPVIGSSTSRAVIGHHPGNGAGPRQCYVQIPLSQSGHLTNRNTWIGRLRFSVRVFKPASGMSERNPHFDVSQCKPGCKEWRKPTIF